MLRRILAAMRKPVPHRRLLPLQPPADPRSEGFVILALAAAAAAFVAFVVLFVLDASTQALGLSFGLGLLLLAAASIVTGKAVVPQEEEEEPRSVLVHPVEETEVLVYVQEGDERITRKRLLRTATSVALLSLGGALVVPLGACGPGLSTDELLRTPWRPGRRLVDEAGNPVAAEDIVVGGFVSAFPEGAERDDFAAPLIVVRIRPDELRLPSARDGWAPNGILGYSKICPHAGCAVSMFRYPLYRPGAPSPALVCPCHYSTFDAARGGKLLFGPAGRALPQLPLQIDGDGHLRAAGGMSGAVGPSWWGVRHR